MSNPRGTKELEAALMRDLGGHLAQLQFVFRPRRREFVLETEHYAYVIHIGFIRHGDEFDATMDIGILLTSVEDLLKRMNWGTSARATVGAEIGNLVDGRPHRWRIQSEPDAIRVGREMAAEFARFGMPWFSRVSDKERLLAELISNDRGSWLLMPLHGKRCATVLALAFLLRSRDEVAAIAEDCERFLTVQRDPQTAAFKELAKRLLATQ